MSVRDEWECVDMKCSHYDGDMCTLGDCLDPPQDREEQEQENEPTPKEN